MLSETKLEIIGSHLVHCRGADVTSPLPEPVEVLVSTTKSGENQVSCPFLGGVNFRPYNLAYYCTAGRRNPARAIDDLINEMPDQTTYAATIEDIDSKIPRCYFKQPL